MSSLWGNRLDKGCRDKGRKGAYMLLRQCGAVNPALAGTSEGASKRLGTLPGSGRAGAAVATSLPHLTTFTTQTIQYETMAQSQGERR